MITIEPNGVKYTLTIDGKVIGKNYSSQSQACKKAYKYLNGQGR